MPTTASAAVIRGDFDAIARLTPESDRPGPCEEWLLKQLPSRRGSALEIGCGVGRLARRLASAFDGVTAIDFSEGMIAEATRRDDASVEFVCVDMFEWLRPRRDTYDCIVTVATLHHMDLASALREIASALKPGGTLLVIDLLHRSGWRGFFVNAVAWVVSLRTTAPWKLRRAYWRHGRNETYLTLDDVERVVREELPGARVRAHLLWRYSVAWQKPMR